MNHFNLSNWFVAACVFVFSFVVLFCGGWRNWKKAKAVGVGRRLPRGRLGWLFIGETLEFTSSLTSCLPESFINKRQLMYGSVFKSHLLGSPTIISTDPEVNKFILHSDTTTFVASYPRSIRELMGNFSILQINGSLHKRVHGLTASFLKSSHYKTQVTTDMDNYLTDCMASWKDQQLIHIQDVAKQVAFQVLVRGLISMEAGHEMQYMKQQFQEFIAGLVSIPLRIPGLQMHRSLQAKERMLKIIKDIIKERRKTNNKCSPKDVLDVLMNDDELDDELISDNVIDFMIPGEESVPTLITLATKFLSDSPIALQQIKEENIHLMLNKAESGEKLSWEDYMALPFTQNVISETLRIGNIVNGVFRKAMKDIEIKGHFIPKGWCVMTYFRSVHLDKNIYDDPYKFNPWRWQDVDVGPYKFTPFGGGLRLCPGIQMARLETSIFLHHLLTKFKWDAKEDSIVNFPTVRMKNGMPIKIQKSMESGG